MGLFDAATAPLRWLLGGAEHEAAEAVEVADPLKDIEEIQTHVLSAVEAIKDATEQIEAHVQVVETLATAVGPLTTAVESLTERLDVIAEALTPLARAEQDVGRLGHIFSRRRLGPPSGGP